MSLHLGNLSPHIRHEDLERVFNKFGRNTIQIKDKYGFVVYDLPENAEKALRALKGKNICGERISVTWSNKQPKPFQRFNKPSRFYEPYHRRNFTRGDYAIRRETTHHERGFKRVPSQLHDEGGRPKLDSFIDKEKDYHRDDLVDHGEENGKNVKEVLIGEDLLVETNLGDTGRWGEPVSSTLDIKEAENVASLDRYQPYHGYARDEDESHYKTTYYKSPARESSRETSRIDPNVNTTVKGADDSRNQLKCYVCGLVGHIKRNCPQGSAPRQERFNRFDPRRDNDISLKDRDSRRIKRVTPESWRRLKSKRSPPPSRRKRDENLRDSRKHPRLTSNEISSLGKDKDSKRKKKHKSEHRDSVKVPRRSKRDGSSTHRSDFTSSSSRSHSPSRSASSGINSHSRSRSRSTPESFRKHSASSTSRSVTSSSKSRSPSRSKSRSASPASLSLSVSLSPQIESSNEKKEIKETVISTENHLDKENRSESMHALIDQRKMIEDDQNIDNPKLKSENGTLLDENRALSIEIGDEKMNMNNTSQLHEDRIGCNANDPNRNPSEKYVVTSDNLSAKSLGELRDPQISVSPEIDDPVSYEEPNPDVPSTSESKNTSISSEEMCVVLKHYGMPTPNENEENLSVETFFGCARLWPWELIYYRRLKKGPISTENYARRVAQNEEFGIVDKYVRSSSGWGERDQSS